jgi:hypothetical protein
LKIGLFNHTQPALRYACLRVSKFQIQGLRLGFEILKVLRIYGFKVSKVKKFEVSRFLGIKVLRNKGKKVSRFQGFRVSRLPRIKISGFEGV